MSIIVKIIVSGLLIGLVTTIARRNASVGGFLAAMPLNSLIASFWLVADKQLNKQLADYFAGVLWGLIPTVVVLLAIEICLRQGLPFWGSIAIGVVIYGAYYFAAQRFGWFGL